MLAGRLEARHCRGLLVGGMQRKTLHGLMWCIHGRGGEERHAISTGWQRAPPTSTSAKGKTARVTFLKTCLWCGRESGRKGLK